MIYLLPVLMAGALDLPGEIDAAKAELAKSRTPELLNRLGFFLMESGKFTDAQGQFEEALRLRTDFAVAENNLGVCLLKQGRPKDAAPHFERAVLLKPDYAKAAFNAAVAYFRQKSYLKAYKWYNKAKKIDKAYVEERGKKDKVDRELNEGIQNDPSNPMLQKAKRLLDSPS